MNECGEDEKQTVLVGDEKNVHNTSSCFLFQTAEITSSSKKFFYQKKILVIKLRFKYSETHENKIIELQIHRFWISDIRVPDNQNFPILLYVQRFKNSRTFKM